MISLRFQRKDGSSTIAARALGTAAIFLVVLLTYLSVDPEAHEHFHHDADGANHHCIITAFAAGEAWVLAGGLVVHPAIAVFSQVQWQTAESLRGRVAHGPVAICGPPSPFFSV